MSTIKKSAKDLFCMTVFALSLAGIFYFNNSMYNFIATGISTLVVGMFSLNRRENFPILLFVVAVQLVALILTMLPAEIVLLPLTASSLLDLLLAFFIVHYHKDPALFRLFRVQEPAKRVPQVYLLSLVLAFSSLFSFLMAGEIMFYFLDENFFKGEVPFFISLSEPVRLLLKLLFDVALWSLLLDPTHWKFLRRIEQRFDL